jgi:hydroxymethylglutaryl-CoA lyase
MTRKIEINDVSPRDGLQKDRHFVPTDAKVAFIDALSDCGFAMILNSSVTPLPG